jgi:DNA mismatch endonuclease (patch repair protein)
MTRTDVLTSAQRSYCMSRIRGYDTKPEILLRKMLWSLGLRYRLKSKLPGSPDFVFPKYRAVVFVDGCFWHGCPDHMTRPKTNSKFWVTKIEKNKKRDLKVNRILRANGWNVLRIWEHEIKDDIKKSANKIASKII